MAARRNLFQKPRSRGLPHSGAGPPLTAGPGAHTITLHSPVHRASRCSALAGESRKSKNYYSEINLHITWHAKGSRPLLLPKVETLVHHYLRGRCINTPGVFVHEVGGIETHVHLCLTVTPTIAIAEFIGQLKGSSAHEVNQKLGAGAKVLEWQSGYGVVSFGTKDLEWVKDYVRNQRTRHASQTTVERLEQVVPVEEAEARPREAP